MVVGVTPVHFTEAAARCVAAMRKLNVLLLLAPTVAWHLPAAARRRDFVIGCGRAPALGAPLAASADEVTDALYGKPKAPDATVFEGTYSDPMHPGGTRTITLQGTRLGPYQLAKIVGGGGQGEPASYELPAMVAPTPGAKNSWQITIEFSPKGGPKDFTGYWDSDGIRFPPTPGQIERGNTAGNKWPKTK